MGLYVALLRGINVGGKNLIKMPALKACFEGGGFREVATYIASGNVLFDSAGVSPAKLVQQIERMLGGSFDYKASVVVRSRKQMRDTVERAPDGFGAEPLRYRYDVIFLKPDVTAAAALKIVPRKEGVDQVHAGPGALYYSRLASKATQSKISRVVSMPVYQSMTIRNWNTTTRLLALMDGGGSAR